MRLLERIGSYLQVDKVYSRNPLWMNSSRVNRYRAQATGLGHPLVVWWSLVSSPRLVVAGGVFLSINTVRPRGILFSQEEVSFCGYSLS